MAGNACKWFNPTKVTVHSTQGGGGGRDVFVRISAVERAGLSSLNEGQAVEYEIAIAARSATNPRRSNKSGMTWTRITDHN
jgi:CspA family cold shock protein